MNNTNSVETRSTKFVGLESLVSSTVAVAVAVVLASASNTPLLTLNNVLAATFASVMSVSVAFFCGNGIANLVGELDKPGLKYHLTFASVAAVISVVTLALAVLAGS